MWQRGSASNNYINHHLLGKVGKGALEAVPGIVGSGSGTGIGRMPGNHGNVTYHTIWELTLIGR